MKTLKQVTINPVFIDGFMPNKNEMEDGKVYISEKYGTSNHKCLCGCGQQTILPINDTLGWHLIKESNGTISFTPSIKNPPPCNAHYIITKNVANIFSYDMPFEQETHAPGSCPL